MAKELYSYQDYKEYLRERISEKSAGGHGQRTKIASVLNCHIAYVSQVLRGDAHFSLEQAAALNGYLSHNEDESDYFLNLVSYCRAGTAALKAYYKKKLGFARSSRLNLKERLQYRKSLERHDEEIYFSNWIYVATHLLLSIPKFQSPERIAKHLGVKQSTVLHVISFLVSRGMVKQKGSKYTSGDVNIHVGNDSPAISRHHENWRLRAIESLKREHEEELHYSSVITITKEAALEIKKRMISVIEEIRSEVKESDEEELFCYSLDLFRPSRNLGHPA